jgi:rRNA maturation endonuclease Nob1
MIFWLLGGLFGGFGLGLFAASLMLANRRVTYRCPRCGTTYFAAQECDWCGVQAKRAG